MKFQTSSGYTEAILNEGSFDLNIAFVEGILTRPYLCLFLFSGVIWARYGGNGFWPKTPSPLLTNFDWGVFATPPVSHEPPSGASKMVRKVYHLCRHFWCNEPKSGFGGPLRGRPESVFGKLSPRKVLGMG